MEFEFNLGEWVKDKITNYSGVVMGRTQYLTQCNVYGVLSTNLNKEQNKPADWAWFDEPRLIRENKKMVTIEPKLKEPKKKFGGEHCINEIAPHR